MAPAAHADDAPAGLIFGQPVPMGNYLFAKRALYQFPRPWEESLSATDRERAVWENLILHFESFRRNITVTDQELEQWINDALRGHQQPFTRSGDPQAYAGWVKEQAQEDVELFEHQMRYLAQIEKLKAQVRASWPATFTEEELQTEFLQEAHHVAGEMVVFETREDAQAFFEQVQEPAAWGAMKTQGQRAVRPVSLMTLEAYVDLWAIPRGQMVAFHALALGAVGPPMPFGTQWCVYRLLEKRTGDLKDFPAKRDAYVQQITAKKQYEGLKKWIEDLRASANLKIFATPSN